MIDKKSIYREIMTGYERQLEDDKRQQRARLQEVYHRIPEYKKLDDRMADLSAEAAIMAARGQKDKVPPVLKELSAITDEKKELLRQNGIAQDYLSIRYVCPDCKDTGYVGREKCHCLSQKLISYYYSQSGIYEKLKQENFSTFSYDLFSDDEIENIRSIHDSALEFTETFADSYRNMIFYGGVGCGKSFMTNCIAKELIDKGIAVVYVSAITLFEILSSHRFGRTSAEDPAYGALFESPLLIIDDLGTEVGSSVTSSELFNVLNERDLRARSTIISTNLSLPEIKDIYSERSVSRIIGGYEFYRFEGADLRLRKRRNT